jgi:hypothetical protein
LAKEEQINQEGGKVSMEIIYLNLLLEDLKDYFKFQCIFLKNRALMVP